MTEIIPGCSYTLFSHDLTAPPVITGWAPGPGAAQYYVQQIMSRDRKVFRGLVRRLDEMTAMVCARSRKPGEFVWLPAPVLEHDHPQAIEARLSGFPADIDNCQYN